MKTIIVAELNQDNKLTGKYVKIYQSEDLEVTAKENKYKEYCTFPIKQSFLAAYDAQEKDRSFTKYFWKTLTAAMFLWFMFGGLVTHNDFSKSQALVNSLQLQLNSPHVTVSCNTGVNVVSFDDYPTATNLWLVIEQEKSGIKVPSDFFDETNITTKTILVGDPVDLLQQDGFSFSEGMYTIYGYSEERSKNPQFLDQNLVFKDQLKIPNCGN